MGRKDNEAEKVAFEVLIRNTIAGDVRTNAAITDDMVYKCDRVNASSSVRSFTCDFQFV